ncbi:MAG: NAD(P)H-dependent oxidoreductase [Bacteroidetes bacterium]|nr:NAD(P)H-dependent oxidoreductase [Bacteroidota bacterium]
MKIAIISASVRKGRNSHRVALYFKNYITEHKIGDAQILDLHEYQFPVFEERLRLLENPSPQTVEFAEHITSADAIVIVTPEYNGGYPASLKNVVDLLYTEWKRKPIAIATVSAGPFGGSQVITSLLFSLWKIGAWVTPAMFPVPNVEKAYTETGEATDKDATDKRAKAFLDELIWCATAKQKMGN